MRITLEKIGKKFKTEWIFRGVDFSFEEHQTTAILGRNGSGKSTLLQIVAGNLHPTAGKITWLHNNHLIPDSEVFRELSLVAPYQELIEEFTLREMLAFHFSFKRMLPGFTMQHMIDLLGFGEGGKKELGQFSSGMKQRVKLATAILSDVPLLLLDEPTMNLDQSGIEWYLNLMNDHAKNRTVIICSNQHQTESAFAESSLSIESYKR